jgi:hypothetical protein
MSRFVVADDANWNAAFSVVRQDESTAAKRYPPYGTANDHRCGLKPARMGFCST